MSMNPSHKRAAGRGGLLLAGIAALALAGCDAVRQQAAENPVAAEAVVTATCEVGKIGLDALPYIGPYSEVVGNAICAQIRAGVTPATAIRFDNVPLDTLYAMSEVKFGDPVLQAELERIRDALDAQAPR